MLETEAKLSHLLAHWVEHHEAHLENYRTWASRAREAGLEQVADALDRAVATGVEAARALRDAAKALDRER